MSMETQILDYNNSYTTSQTSNVGKNQCEKQAEVFDPPGNRGLGIDHGLITEIEAYQGLMLDFEREFSDFLSSDLPKCPKIEDSQHNEDCDDSNENSSATSRNRGDRRRSSAVTSSRSSSDGAANDSGRLTGINYNFDGTISCCDISYDLLVS